ncbi:MAG: DUF2619 domain-containing protein [Bacillota bacterium]
MDKFVLTMGTTRLIFGLMNLVAAIVMFRLNSVEQGLRINGILGAIGPFVFVSAVGLAGVAAKLPPQKALMLLAGVTLTILGTR